MALLRSDATPPGLFRVWAVVYVALVAGTALGVAIAYAHAHVHVAVK